MVTRKVKFSFLARQKEKEEKKKEEEALKRKNPRELKRVLPDFVKSGKRRMSQKTVGVPMPYDIFEKLENMANENGTYPSTLARNIIMRFFDIAEQKKG